MEKEFYTDEFEQLIKEKADQFRMYPSKRVWHSIYNNLHPSRRWPSVLMGLFLVSSLMLIGYLHTGDNRTGFNQPINIASITEKTDQPDLKINRKKQISTYTKIPQQVPGNYANSYENIFPNQPDLSGYIVVRSNRPNYTYASTTTEEKITDKKYPDNEKDIVQTVDNYIKNNKIFADVTASNKKNKVALSKTKAGNTAPGQTSDDNTYNETDPVAVASAKTSDPAPADLDKTANADSKLIAGANSPENKKALSDEEKAWIENFTLQLNSQRDKWKKNLSFQFYITPAVNYRKLSTNSKGSTSAFANSDINNSISQKPGFGMETGVGLTYAIAKRLQLRGGLQFNYTNYNISADQTNHPIITTILLNDPNTGYSYSAARTSTTSNAYNSNALQPVTLHNRTYQVSVPLGFAYKLSSEQNVDWFAGATLQPTYIFGGNAHLISSDLKSYVSDPSSISSWNLNLGFETFMNFRLKGFNFQVGPQVRYQVFSTYRKNVALIEKPYAVGLKLGLVKGF